LIIFRKTAFVKKYGRYALILLPALIFILLKLLSKPKKKENDQKSKDNLTNYIAEIKDQLQEANMITAVEVTAAKEKNNQKLEVLKETMAISDAKERRKRLADMIG
jgi:hypothetical protein